MGKIKTIDDNRPTNALIAGICETSGGQALVVEYKFDIREMNPFWLVKASGGTTIRVHQDDTQGARENAIRAAVLFCEHMGGVAEGWDPRELVMGGIPGGGYVFTFAGKPKRIPNRLKYIRAAVDRLTGCGLEQDGDFLLDEDNPWVEVTRIEEEQPGAWVGVEVWIDDRDIEEE